MSNCKLVQCVLHNKKKEGREGRRRNNIKGKRARGNGNGGGKKKLQLYSVKKDQFFFFPFSGFVGSLQEENILRETKLLVCTRSVHSSPTYALSIRPPPCSRRRTSLHSQVAFFFSCFLCIRYAKCTVSTVLYTGRCIRTHLKNTTTSELTNKLNAKSYLQK